MAMPPTWRSSSWSSATRRRRAWIAARSRRPSSKKRLDAMKRSGPRSARRRGRFPAGPGNADPCGGPASVTIVDQLSAGQQEENDCGLSRRHAGGDAAYRRRSPDRSVHCGRMSGPPHLHYTLCGRLLRRELDGSVSTHRIDNGGVLGGRGGADLVRQHDRRQIILAGGLRRGRHR